MATKHLNNRPTGVKLLAFFKNTTPLSNWYIAPFTCRTLKFNCIEQYMMWSKAILFGDRDAAMAILATPDPAEQKRLGRTVRGFNEKTWSFASPTFVREGLVAKFSQNQECYDILMAARGHFLVEASPYDKVWGAGLAVSDPRLETHAPSEWPGENRLGILLTGLHETFDKVISREAQNRATSASSLQVQASLSLGENQP